MNILKTVMLPIILIVIRITSVLASSELWKMFEDSKFSIKYPAGWVIREQDTDADGYYYSFKDNTPTMGGIGVYFITQTSIFGSEKTRFSLDDYKKAMIRVVELEGKYVGDIVNNGIAGKKFTATQQVFRKTAEWRVDLFPYGRHMCFVFGFFRPDNVKQKALIYEVIDSIKLISPVG